MSTPPTDRTDYPDAPAERSCTRKKAYYEERLAKRVARDVNEREGRPVVVHYACTRCGCWHIGRAPS